ncbi:MAG TPA: fumarylacetoacetate hydrolase family protein [Solirubrobacterales bacterium]|jgi:acylpyruvate hydrolase
MRLVSYENEGRLEPGILIEEMVVPAAAAAERAEIESPRSTRGLLEAGPVVLGVIDDAARRYAEELGRPLGETELGPPLPDPDKIICVGLNYRDHAAESGLDLPAAPMLFPKFRPSLVGPNAPVEAIALSDQIDYEAELAIVIGRAGRNITAADALDHVAGAMAFNDLTARDLQHQTSQWTAGKAIDGFAPCGPALVLLDEIDDLSALSIRARVNGELVQDGNTGEMIFTVPELIEFISSLMTLVPGDIIATGTPAGVGVSRDPQLFLEPGDMVEVEVEGIGALRTVLTAPRAAARADTAGVGR